MAATYVKKLCVVCVSDKDNCCWFRVTVLSAKHAELSRAAYESFIIRRLESSISCFRRIWSCVKKVWSRIGVFISRHLGTLQDSSWHWRAWSMSRLETRLHRVQPLHPFLGQVDS